MEGIASDWDMGRCCFPDGRRTRPARSRAESLLERRLLCREDMESEDLFTEAKIRGCTTVWLLTEARFRSNM